MDGQDGENIFPLLKPPPITTPDEREIEHEQDAWKRGFNKYIKDMKKARKKGHEHATAYGRSIEVVAFDRLTRRLETIKKEGIGRPGPKPMVRISLQYLDAETIALRTLQEVIRNISQSRTRHEICRAIGERIEDEIYFKPRNEKEDAYMAKTLRNRERRGEGLDKRKKALTSIRRKGIDAETVKRERWTVEQRRSCGLELLYLLRDETEIVEIRNITRGKRTESVVQASSEWVEYIREHVGKSALASPEFVPMLTAPRRWTGPTGGGYFLKELRRPLFRAKYRGHFSDFRREVKPEFFDALNAIQETPWKINKAVLSVANYVKDRKLSVGDLPAEIKHLSKDQRPANADERALRKWRQSKDREFEEVRKNNCKHADASEVLKIANNLADELAIYFPIFCDNRGRVYYRPSHLNPQTSDLARGLLMFSIGTKLDERGIRWLKIHLANTYAEDGTDKKSFEERIAWTDQQQDRIIRLANDPLGDEFPWWGKADKHFQFLAAAIEWKNYLEQGPTYISTLPITVDGTCNGLQHLAALIRDSAVGEKVNLVPADRPADIYQTVADRVKQRLQDCVAGNQPRHEDGKPVYGVRKSKYKGPADNESLARLWLDKFNINRKLLKSSVMIFPYNGSKKAMRKYVREEIGKVWPSELDDYFYPATAFLVAVAWEELKTSLPGPIRVRAWLKECATALSKTASPVSWTTPSGFWAAQWYPVYEEKRVKTCLSSTRAEMRYRKPTDSVDSSKQQRTLSPNFIHSLDAAALCMTVRLGLQRGIRNLITIHDTFGANASDIDDLQDCIRLAFIDMYHNRNLLQEWSENHRPLYPPTPPPPAQGSLDIEQVRHSKYFFA